MTEHTCHRCNKGFDKAEALSMHKQAKHPEAVPGKSFSWTPSQKKKMRSWIVTLAAIGLLIGGIYALVANREPPNPLVPTEAIHWHPTLKIIINGEQQIIPANLGLGTRHLPIHTHDTSGVLHYENSRPTAQNMKLGFFFKQAWKKTFNSNCIFEYCNGPAGTVKMAVNGQPNTEFDDFIPQGDDEITIEYK